MQDDPSPPVPSAAQLFWVFSRIGLTSFGGGLSGWFLREFVQRRRWLSEEEFLNGLALSQALPGVNVTNMAIWIGFRLRGTPGALAGLAGIVVPPGILIILIASAFDALSGYRVTHLALSGAAAAAIGLSLSMAITTMRRVPRRIVPITLMVATFVMVAVLRWPLPWVVLGTGAVGIASAYWSLGRA
jgi:chromate transporter